MLRNGGELTGVLGGPDEARVPARRRHNPEELLSHADIVIVGGEDPVRLARNALEADKHVSVGLPFTSASRTLLKVARLARARDRVLHLFAPALYVPAMRTLRGHTRPNEVRAVSVLAASVRPVSPTSEGLVIGHLPALCQLVAVGGPIRAVQDLRVSAGSLEAVFEMSAGFRADLHLSEGASADESDLRATTELQWRLHGMHLYCGASMTTLTDNRSPSELGMLELQQIVDPASSPSGRAPKPTFPVEALFHVLKVSEALAAGHTGTLS